MSSDQAKAKIPSEWDRNGLPAWSYFNDELLEAEKKLLFRQHWQLVCHKNDLPDIGDFMTLDIVGERALIIRETTDRIRAFHNLCRHRGSRVLQKSAVIVHILLSALFMAGFTIWTALYAVLHSQSRFLD